jgi:hypothetical protein
MGHAAEKKVQFAGICRNLGCRAAFFFTPRAAAVRRAIKKSANARKRPQSLGGRG